MHFHYLVDIMTTNQPLNNMIVTMITGVDIIHKNNVALPFQMGLDRASMFLLKNEFL